MAERLDEHFRGDVLNPHVWFPYYLPHWSSRAASRAVHTVGDGSLRLFIPPDQPLWCAESHPTPLRVSCVQSGARSGQQPFRTGLEVRSPEPDFRGYVPLYGRFSVRMRGVVTPRSMVAFWLSGFEEEPEQSGEICVAEIFGSTPHDVGMGVHRFRDPALREEFDPVTLPIDLATFHTYGVEWLPGSLAFSVDGVVVRRLAQAPAYPMQLMLGVFDFPDKGGPVAVPELVVSHVSGRPPVFGRVTGDRATNQESDCAAGTPGASGAQGM
ncbi:glycoside hydrolase family 16 protein [Asanoa sp. NPDC050611]|uniref:glycoside hydrolase family 16 protein n=1 Tax=Asanoa sp. NPDC050611 TaxID=3157098 RepID=UPI00340489EE